MMWFNEETVKRIILDAEQSGMADYPKNYPHIEIPDKHGRLGDLDLVEEWMRKKHKEHDCPFDIDAFIFALKKFPTVLEAGE